MRVGVSGHSWVPKATKYHMRSVGEDLDLSHNGRGVVRISWSIIMCLFCSQTGQIQSIPRTDVCGSYNFARNSCNWSSCRGRYYSVSLIKDT